MKFKNILKRITAPTKQEHVLSRLYGYQRNSDGNMSIVESEARVIESVITALATRPLENLDTILDDLVQRFSDDGIRNRSAQKWTRKTILALVRPIYSGSVVSKFGVWRRSKLYPQIVNPNYLKLALRRVNGQNVA